MERGQPSASAATQTPSFALPSFLDVRRLPDLQAAWREHFGTAEKPAFPAPMGVGARDIAAETEEGSVRTRAEELSRRFAIGTDGEEGAQTASDAPDATPAAADSSTGDAAAPTVTSESERADPTETASIHVNSSADVAGTEQALPRGKVVDGINKRSAAQKISASPPARSVGVDDTPAIENVATKSVGRASRSPTPTRRIERPASSPTLLMAIGGLFVGSSDTPEPEGATMLPNELRSFGWRSQP